MLFTRLSDVDRRIHIMKNNEKNIKLNNSEELTNIQTVKKLTWKITPTSTPLFKRKCSKCRNSNLYYCSDKFRLNSQKKYIDVWLIYRCVKCDDTCNITILSRTKPELIDKALFLKFSQNDKNTAWQYSFDMDTIRKNKMELDYSHVNYDIECESISLEDIVSMKCDLIEFEVNTNFDINLRLTSLIRRYFALSANQLEKMLNTEVITISAHGPAKKCKITNGVIVRIHRSKLK